MHRIPLMFMTPIVAFATDAPNPAHWTPTSSEIFWANVWIVGSWLYFLLLIWMVIYCLRNDPDRYIWVLVMLILQPLGAILYFFVRWLPSSQLQPPAFLQRWTKAGELRQLETAALQIGNAHQFIQYGEALKKVGLTEKACDAFRMAVQKDTHHLAALWGTGSTEFQLGQFTEAKEHLEKVLVADPAYKFGDVSLLYGKTLVELGDLEAARVHLEKHIQKWRQPEGLFLLAQLQQQAGHVDEARILLRSLIVDIDSSPKAIARKHLFWKSRAKTALRKLPESPVSTHS